MSFRTPSALPTWEVRGVRCEDGVRLQLQAPYLRWGLDDQHFTCSLRLKPLPQASPTPAAVAEVWGAVSKSMMVLEKVVLCREQPTNQQFLFDFQCFLRSKKLQPQQQPRLPRHGKMTILNPLKKKHQSLVALKSVLRSVMSHKI